jgi:hypothetical protein
LYTKKKEFRRAGADKVRRVLGGDVTLLDEIERRHAEIARTEQEAFLLGASTSQAVVPADEPTPMQLYRLEVERVQAEMDWTGLDWNPVSQCCKMAGKPR